MTNKVMVDILVRKIKNGEINPITGQAMVLNDIKIEEYRLAAETVLNQGVV